MDGGVLMAVGVTRCVRNQSSTLSCIGPGSSGRELRGGVEIQCGNQPMTSASDASRTVLQIPSSLF
jgi:hypothetical protein